MAVLAGLEVLAAGSAQLGVLGLRALAESESLLQGVVAS
jgi:hypothetical protein